MFTKFFVTFLYGTILTRILQTKLRATIIFGQNQLDIIITS